MGHSYSKGSAKIQVPFGNKIVRIATYNINQIKSIHSKRHMATIINDIVCLIQNETYDIVLLQGILDEEIMYDIINATPLTINTVPSKLFNSECASVVGSSCGSDKIIPTNLLLTRFIVKDYGIENITDDQNNIFENHYCSFINLEIYGRIISIYGTQLTNDINNIKNTNIRNMEMEKILYIIQQNADYVIDKFEANRISNVHILLGCLNISETFGGLINKEYVNLMRKVNGLDIYRLLNQKNPGNTTIYKTRTSYTIILIKENEILESIDNEYIKNKMFEYYGIYPLESIVCLNMQHSDHFPVVTTFMMKDYTKKNKKSIKK